MMSGMAKQKWSEEARKGIEAVQRGESTYLNLSSEELDEFPAEVLELQTLRALSLSASWIRVIPDSIRSLSDLEVLRLIRNPIESVPDIPGLVLDVDAWHRMRHPSPAN